MGSGVEQAHARAHRLPRAARPRRMRRHPHARRSERLRPGAGQSRARRRRGRAGRPAEPRVAPARPRWSAIGAEYDFILIDCPPSLSLLTVNALVAAAAVLIPMQCEYYALEGLSDLVGTIKRVRANLNPRLEIAGLLRTMFDPRNTLAQQVSQQLEAALRRQGLPHARAAQRAPGRGAELRRAGGGVGQGLEGRAGLRRARRGDAAKGRPHEQTQGIGPRPRRAARRRRGQRAQGQRWRRCRSSASGPASTSRARGWTSRRSPSWPPRSGRRA